MPKCSTFRQVGVYFPGWLRRHSRNASRVKCRKSPALIWMPSCLQKLSNSSSNFRQSSPFASLSVSCVQVSRASKMTASRGSIIDTWPADSDDLDLQLCATFRPSAADQSETHQEIATAVFSPHPQPSWKEAAGPGVRLVRSACAAGSGETAKQLRPVRHFDKDPC